MTEKTEVDWKTVTIASLLERLYFDNQIGQFEETAQSISSRAETAVESDTEKITRGTKVTKKWQGRNVLQLLKLIVLEF